jgi:hypothetical protein
VSGASHTDTVGSQVVEDSGEPLPVAVMHGEEESRSSGLGPSGGDLGQGSEVEAVPTTGQEEDGFAQSIAKKLAGEVEWRVGENRLGEESDFGFAGNGQPAP